MEKIKLNLNGTGLFKGSNTTKAAKSPSTNPFGISFKGNVIQADVFEVSTKNTAENLKDKITNKGKMFTSAVVGNINTFNNALKSRVNSVISFGKQIKDGAVNAWQKAARTDVGESLKTTMESIQAKFADGQNYSVRSLTKKPAAELESMLRAEING